MIILQKGIWAKRGSKQVQNGLLPVLSKIKVFSLELT